MNVQSIRLFVSSTFSDMHAERDRLNRFVFPLIRNRCMQRGIDFVGVDLRWGLTRAEAEKGEIVDLCLEEVDRCRPFFLCLIGDRYGWTPAPGHIPKETFSKVRDDLADEDGQLLDSFYRLDSTREQPEYVLTQDVNDSDNAVHDLIRIWENAGLPLTGRSLTELEIHRAIFDGRVRPAHALFYLRRGEVHLDPRLPKRFIPIFADQEPEQKRRLDTLRQRLLAVGSDYVVREYYVQYEGLRIEPVYLPKRLSKTDRASLRDGVIQPDEWPDLSDAVKSVIEEHGTIALGGLDAWAQQLVDDLWDLIERQIGRTTCSGKPVPRLGQYHERFITERTRYFVGREDVLDQIASDAEPVGVRTLLALTGPAGSGKSSIVAQCIVECRKRHPDAVVLPFFVGAAPGSTELLSVIRYLCEALRDACELDQQVSDDPSELVNQLRPFLEQAARKRPVILLLDALNQLDPHADSHALRWLPVRLPANLRLIVSTLPGQCLDQLRFMLSPERFVNVPLLPKSDRESIVRYHLRARGKKLTHTQLKQLLDSDKRPDSLLPLYLLVALEELSLFGDFQGLKQRISNLPPNLPGLFEQVLVRLEHDHGRDRTEHVLRWLAASRAGLRESEIRDMLDDHFGFTPPLWWSQFRLALDFYLQRVDETASEATVSFYHDQLRLAVEQRYFENSRDGKMAKGSLETHRELAGYFGKAARDNNGMVSWKSAPSRSLAELTFHQARGELVEELEGVLCDPSFLEAKLRVQASAPVLQDFDLMREVLQPHDHSQRSAGFDLIQEALRLSSHSLTSDPSQLGSQLWARLISSNHSAVQKLLDNVCRQQTGWWLRPYTSTLTSAGSPLRRTLAGMNCVSEVRVSPDGNLAMATDDDYVIWVWDIAAGTVRAKIQRDAWITATAMHPRHPLAVVGREDGVVEVVDLNAALILRTLFSMGEEVESLAFADNGKTVLSGLKDGTLGIVGFGGSGSNRRLDIGFGAIRAITVVPDDTIWLAIENRAEGWDLKKETRITSLADHDDTITSLGLSPDGVYLAVGFEDGTIQAWDLNRMMPRTFDGHHDQPTRNEVSGLGFMSDGRLISGSWDKTLRIWDVNSGQQTAKLTGHSSAIYDISLLPDDGRVVTSSKDGTLRVWDTNRTDFVQAPPEHTAAVDKVAVCDKAGVAVSGSRDRTIKVWDLETGQVRRSWQAAAGFKPHEGWIEAIAVDKVNGQIVSAAKDGTLRTWNLDDGQQLKCVTGNWKEHGTVSMNTDGSVVISSDSKHTSNPMSVWRPTRKTKLGVVPRVHGLASCVSPDGTVAVVAGLDRSLYVVDVATCKVRWGCPGDNGDSTDYAESLAIDRENQFLVLGYKSAMIQVWELAALGTLTECAPKWVWQRKDMHTDRVMAVAIAPNAKLACSASWDRTLRVWRIDTGEELATFSSDDFWSSCCFSEDNSVVVAGDERGAVHFLKLEMGVRSGVFT